MLRSNQNNNSDSEKMRRRLRVLVLSYECSPVRSHVEGSAWKLITRLCRRHHLTVITHEEKYREEIELVLNKAPWLSERLHFVYVSEPYNYYPANARPPLPIKAILGYRRWQKRSYDVAMQLHERHCFDVVHHLRTNTFREPGYAWQLPIPLVWGPTGGTTQIPWILLPSLAWKDALQHAFRNIITGIQLRWSRRVRCAARSAAVVLAQTQQDQKMFRRFWGIEPWLAHEQAMDLMDIHVRQYDGQRPLRAIWVGRLVASKGLSLALKALAHQDIAGRVELHIMGDGPKKTQLHAMAKILGVDRHCRWHGWQSPKTVIQQMYASDVFFFSSLLEATSTAVTQALSSGLPVICLKHCGFGDIVDATCGLTTAVGPEHAVVKGFRRSLWMLVNEPGQIETLSRGAFERARQVTWDHVAETIERAYQTAVKRVSCN